MKTMVSYVQTEQRTFAELPFNSVDSLVLSTLAYCNYEAANNMFLSDIARISLCDVLATCTLDLLVQGNWLEDAKDTQLFFRALAISRRYRGLELGFYINETSSIVEKQFSAITLFLDNGFAYLAFRGTDGSFAGWKEDFNLSFKNVIPSQIAAAAYLSGVASACNNLLYLGGHSKGGNLAEYAALVADDSVFKRIRGVYDHDGPSFLNNPSPRFDTKEYESVLHKTVPESSAFGMILERRTNYSVVKSSAFSVFQHEPFSWLVENNDFIYQDELNRTAQLFDTALDTWLQSKTRSERERFVDTIYELFVSTDVNTWAEYSDRIISNTLTLLENGSKLDEETRRFILHTFASLGRVFRQETIKTFKDSSSEWIPFRRESYGENTVPDESDDKENLQDNTFLANKLSCFNRFFIHNKVSLDASEEDEISADIALGGNKKL